MFCELYNDIIEEILNESLAIGYIADLNKEIESLKRQLKGNRIQFRKELKKIKKRLIGKLVKENHNNLLSDFFPHLKDKTKLSDDEFRAVLFTNPDNWSNITMEDFQKFSHTVENSINYFYQRNHHENDNIKYLRHDYVK
jgi:hypothetical protein